MNASRREIHIALTQRERDGEGFGYEIHVADVNGDTILRSDRDPSTGRYLIFLSDALQVAAMYS